MTASHIPEIVACIVVVLYVVGIAVAIHRAESPKTRAPEVEQLSYRERVMWSALHDISYINEPRSGVIATRAVFETRPMMPKGAKR